MAKKKKKGAVKRGAKGKSAVPHNGTMPMKKMPKGSTKAC